MKKIKDYLNEAKPDKKMKSTIDKSVKNLWNAYNELELVIPAYLKQVEQAGLVSTFEKKFIKPLKSAIEKIDDATDNKGPF